MNSNFVLPETIHTPPIEAGCFVLDPTTLSSPRPHPFPLITKGGEFLTIFMLSSFILAQEIASCCMHVDKLRLESCEETSFIVLWAIIYNNMNQAP